MVCGVGGLERALLRALLAAPGGRMIVGFASSFGGRSQVLLSHHGSSSLSWVSKSPREITRPRRSSRGVPQSGLTRERPELFLGCLIMHGYIGSRSFYVKRAFVKRHA